MHCSCANTARTLENISIHIETFLTVPARAVCATLCKRLDHLKGCSCIKNNFCSLVIKDYKYISKNELSISQEIRLNVNVFSSSTVVSAMKN